MPTPAANQSLLPLLRCPDCCGALQDSAGAGAFAACPARDRSFSLADGAFGLTPRSAPPQTRQTV